MITIILCNGVAIKKVNNMPAAPKYLTTLAAFCIGIFFEKSIKNRAKLMDRKIIPTVAQGRDALSEPFIAFASNRLLIKFSDQLKPIEL
ncbi:MAG: hypothetical protein V4538_12175 [Bacteroidota bacterium]